MGIDVRMAEVWVEAMVEVLTGCEEARDLLNARGYDCSGLMVQGGEIEARLAELGEIGMEEF